MNTLPWFIALAAVVLLGLVCIAWWRQRSARPGARWPSPEMPTEWAVTARPVFSASERRIHRLLREALPNQLILSKLPLVRFCQPVDPGDVRYWYELLEGLHVTFAICTPNGRVLAAIDLESRRGQSRRASQIKHSVLRACQVPLRNVRADEPPSIAELQALVPPDAPATRANPPAAAPRDLDQARDSLASTVASRRAERTALWQDSTVFQDSFFSQDSRLDPLGGSDFTPLAGGAGRASAPSWPDAQVQSEFASLPGLDDEDAADDVGGRVVDTPRSAGQSRR